MKLIPDRVKSVGRSIKNGAARLIPQRDRESLTIVRKGKKVVLRNGAHKAKITYATVARAKEVAQKVMTPTEEAISTCPIA